MKPLAEAFAVEMRQQLAILAVDLLIGEDHLVDAVIVPLVVGRHLVDPLDRAGVDVARPDGHRPFVVARSLFRIPGRRITRAVIDQIERGIEGIPTPCVAAADLPLIALPGAGAGVLADWLAKGGGLFRIDQGVGIGTHGIAAPGELAVLDVIGAQPAAYAELAAGYADKDFVLEDEWSVSAGLSLRSIAILDRPNDRASLRVQGDQRLVRQMEKNLAVGVGQAAVDR